MSVRVMWLLFGAFLVIAATVAAVASFTMFFTGTVVDNIWRVKEHDFQELLRHAAMVGASFALLSVALACAAIGWFRLRRWGWLLSLLVLCANFAGDLATIIATRSWIDLLGVCIEAVILTWLLRPRTRALFA